MHPDMQIASWQALFILTGAIALPVGLWALFSGADKRKRREMLKALHEQGEIEIVRLEGDLLEVAANDAAFKTATTLVQEGIVSAHDHKALRRNAWVHWRTYRLTHPKGIELATRLFGSPPQPPPQDEEEIHR